MTNTDFILLRDHILDKNKYFNQGFANVYQDATTGLIYQGDSSEKFAVGIDDTFGNYFYLRTDPEIRYNDSRPQLRDSKPSLDENVRSYLVAVVDDARPKDLVQCLLDTLLKYSNERIRPVRAIYIREAAIAKELSKLVKEDVEYALQNLGERQVIIIEFEFNTRFSPLPDNCIINPCNTCVDE